MERELLYIFKVCTFIYYSCTTDSVFAFVFAFLFFDQIFSRSEFLMPEACTMALRAAT